MSLENSWALYAAHQNHQAFIAGWYAAINHIGQPPSEGDVVKLSKNTDPELKGKREPEDWLKKNYPSLPNRPPLDPNDNANMDGSPSFSAKKGG